MNKIIFLILFAAVFAIEQPEKVPKENGDIIEIIKCVFENDLLINDAKLIFDLIKEGEFIQLFSALRKLYFDGKTVINQCMMQKEINLEEPFNRLKFCYLICQKKYKFEFEIQNCVRDCMKRM